MTSCVTRDSGGKDFFPRISAGPLVSHEQGEVEQMGRQEEKINELRLHHVSCDSQQYSPTSLRGHFPMAWKGLEPQPLSPVCL